MSVSSKSGGNPCDRPADERIGILLVHGIGEQGRYEHLTGEARCLVAALRTLHPDATVEIAQGSSTALLGRAESWCADGNPPLQVTLRRPDGRLTAFCFHEVWWADIGEPYSLSAAVRFWWWGLSVWALPHPRHRAEAQMALPVTGTHDSVPWSDRGKLIFLGTMFLFVALTVGALDFVGRRLRIGTIPVFRQLINYLGDVKLYTDRRRYDGDVLPDVGQPPRVAIRRRMVGALADMALAGYDRWFVWAHSLGTVVAYNALMETAHSLPNYLNRTQWAKLCAAGIAGTGVAGEDWPADAAPAGTPPTDPMMPPRPPWLAADEVVHRQRLFAALQGFVTYGSPLDKFATLWPTIVPQNRLERVFPPGFQWMNVYDPTDPVGAALDFFKPLAGSGPGKPAGGLAGPDAVNFGYRAHPVLLYSHIQYLKASGGSFATMLVHWALGQWSPSLPLPAPGDGDSWLRTPAEVAQRERLARLEVAGVVLLLLLLGSAIFGLLLPAVLGWGSAASMLTGLWWSLGLIGFGIVATLGTGVLRHGWPKPVEASIPDASARKAAPSSCPSSCSSSVPGEEAREAGE